MKPLALGSVTVTSLLILILATSNSAYAYRGMESTYTSDIPKETPTSHIPGYFDANVANKGKVIFEIPTFSFDMGITDHLTVGVNVLSLGAAVAFASPAGMGKVRYRFFSNDQVASSLTIYGGGIRYTRNSGALSGYMVNVTSNTSWYATEHDVLSLHVGVLTAGGQNENQTSVESVGGVAVVAGAGYQHFFGRVFGMEAQIFAPAYLNASTTTVGLDANLNFLKNDTWYLLHRLLLNFNIPKMHSVASLGLIGAYETANARENVFPIIFWTLGFK